jgi:hypothetical protein
MFGAFRYLLALLVVMIHVWPGFMLRAAVYAVFAFYRPQRVFDGAGARS